MVLFSKIFDEYIITKKTFDKRSNKKDKNSIQKFILVKNGDINLEQQTDLFLENKISILEDLILNLKNKFIFKKITDISKNIRMMVCDYITKICKFNFTEFFDDDSIKYFPFFLIDPNDQIKSKYLQLIYEKLDQKEENDTGCIIKILKESRDSILNICIKEEKILAKRAIKIIELLSQHNILDIKTVNLLLPHLFNPDPHIRDLISNIVLNYILNFESRDIIREAEEIEENQEDEIDNKMDIDENNEDENTSIKNKNKNYKFSIEDLIEILEFFSKLTEKDEKMIKVLVDNFYPKLKIFKNFSFFFDLIDQILNRKNQNDLNNTDKILEEENNSYNNQLLKICLIVLKYSIEKLQEDIDNSKSSTDELMKDQIPLNEEFLNHLVLRSPSLIKIILLDEQIFYETFIELTNLFENFRIYNLNLLKFNNEKIHDILTELQKVFFYTLIQKNNSGEYYSFNNFMSNSVDNIGKTIIKLTNFLSINKSNEDFLDYNEKTIIKEICKKTFEKITNLIFSHTIFVNEEINENNFTNEDCENFFYIMVRFDCVLNHFGNFNEFFINNINYLKFQNFIFNIIYYYRDLNKININKISLFLNESNNKNSSNIFLVDNIDEYKIDKKKKSQNSLVVEINGNIVEGNRLRRELINSEFFLQNFTNYGINLLKSINLVILSKVIFNLNSNSINENNNPNTNSDMRYLSNFNMNSANVSSINSNQSNLLVEIYSKYLNNLFDNFEKILDWDFQNIQILDNNNANNEQKKIFIENLLKIIQEKRSFNIEIKSKFICLILELLIFISSEKLEIYSANCENKLKYQINDILLNKIEDFLKKEFVLFFLINNNKLIDLNKTIKNLENEDNNDTEEENKIKIETLISEKKMIESNLSFKTILLKNICESYSKLLIQNLGIFKNRNLICLFFETFYLIKFPTIIESINNIVYQNLLEKEITYYLKDDENNKLNWMIFYFTKIAVKLFDNNSKIFSFKNKHSNNLEIPEDISYDLIIDQDEKILYLKRYFEVYLKSIRNIKSKLSKEQCKKIDEKDKKFLEEFICKSINFSLDSKIIKEKEIPNENKLNDNNILNNDDISDSLNNNPRKVQKIIHIEYVKFLELIRFILKSTFYITEIEYKTFLMIFVKLVKIIEVMDNINLPDLKIIESMKNYLLTKAKLFLSYDEKESEDDKKNTSNHKEDVENDKTDEEKNDEISEDEKKLKIFKKKINKKGKKKKKENNIDLEKEEDKVSENEKKDSDISEIELEVEEDIVKEKTNVKKKKKNKSAIKNVNIGKKRKLDEVNLLYLKFRS